MAVSKNGLNLSFSNILSQSHRDSTTMRNVGANNTKEEAARTKMSVRSERPLLRRLTKFSKDSSFSGTLYAFKSKSIAKRVYWGMCVVLAVAGFCTVTGINIYTLVRKPINTSITVTRQTSLEFPAITICSLSYLNTTKLNEIGNNLTLKLHALFDSIRDPNECPDIASDIVNGSKYSGGFSALINKHAKNDLQKLIHTCSFLGRDCSEDYTISHTIDGNCFTFNGPAANHVYVTSGIGEMYGLRLHLFNGQQNFSIDGAVGYKVIIHDRNEAPIPVAGVSVGFDSVLFLGMEKKESLDNTRYSFLSKNCIRDPDSEILDYNITILDHNYTSYSPALCQSHCQEQYIADQCNCVERGFYNTVKSPYKEMRDCTMLDLCCETLAFVTFNKTCDCPQKCDITDYELTVSSATHNREGMATINVYFNSLILETSETTDSYSVWSLISDVGGNTGLFLGFTLLTLAEVVMLGVGLLSDCFKTKPRQNFSSK